MVVLSYKKWKLVRFEKSNKKDKKVVAILTDGEKERLIHFGQKGSTTYKDDTKVGGDPIHNDKARRERYRKRHEGEGSIDRKYSAGWFSWKYLW